MITKLSQIRDLKVPAQTSAFVFKGKKADIRDVGKKAESDAALAEFLKNYQAVGAFNVAQAYAFRGEADRAFQWLDKAYDQHDGGMFLVMVDPLLTNLKNDPRFKELLKKMKLRPL